MKTFILIILCYSFSMMYHSIGKETTGTAGDEIKIEKETKISPDKSSISAPIVLNGVEKYSQIKHLQQEYIRKKYEGYHVVVDMITQDADQHYIQCFMLENEEGQQAFVFFDITDIVGKRHKKHNQELKDIIKKIDNNKN